MRNRVTAAILSFTMGMFGMQWFYLGERSRAIGRMVCTFSVILMFVSAILSLADCITFLSMDQAEFDKLYNNGKCSDVATLLNGDQGDNSEF